MCAIDFKSGKYRIDPCIQDEIDLINSGFYNSEFGDFRTRLSCCGHEKYPYTIVVENRLTGRVFEWFTGIDFNPKYKNGKKRKRFYKKDSEDYYFIPELMEALLGE